MEYILNIQATATRINLILVLALARVVIQQRVIHHDNHHEHTIKARSNDTGFEKYEMCIKSIMICFLLEDAAIDYDDTEEIPEEVGDVHVRNKETIIQTRFKRARCIPRNITSAARAKFWKTARMWQLEVEKFFLNENMFIQIEGKNGYIKIKLWDVYNMPQNVTCNGTISLPTKTTVPPPTSSIPNGSAQCDERQEIAIWIGDQVAGVKGVDTLTSKVEGILDQLSQKINGESCHPYADIWNKIEMINDNIDLILKLRGLDLPVRHTATGNTKLDLQNLAIRLQYLKQEPVDGKQTGSMCCKNWDEQVKGVRDRITALLQFDQSATSSSYDELHQSYIRLQQNFALQVDRLIKAEKVYNSQVNAKRIPCPRCAVLESRLIDLEKRLHDRNKVISSAMTRMLEINENPEQRVIYTDSDNDNDHEDISHLSLNDRLAYIERKIKKMNNNAIDIIEYYKKLSSSIANEDHRKIYAIREELNRLQEEPKNPDLTRNFHVIENYQTNVELNNCLKELNTACHAPIDGIDFGNDETNILKLEVRVTEHLKILKKLHKKSEEQKSKITDFREEMNKQLEEKEQLLKSSDAKEAKRQNDIKVRIDQLEQNIIEANANSKDISNILNKLQAMEKSLDSIPAENNNQALLETIERLKKDLAVLNERIDKINASAQKCSSKCDWGDLPSAEELQERLQALEMKLKKLNK